MYALWHLDDESRLRRFCPSTTTVILLTTFKCGALGLNIHTYCSRIVLMEAARNYNSVFVEIT